MKDSVNRLVMLRTDLCSGVLKIAGPQERPGWAGCLLDNRLWTTSFNGDMATISLTREFDREDPLYRLLLTSLLMSLSARGKDGLYIHGALAEKDGQGVIMAGTWGAGKSTASNRLPPSWHSVCDDKIMVVRDSQGGYWAHPWPTWSRFLPGGQGGTWNSQRAVPLKGIFFLAQSPDDRVEPMSFREGAYALIESSRQALRPMIRELGREDRKLLCTQIFESAYALAMKVQCNILHLTLRGEFWTEMEKCLPPLIEI
ncbi:MAG TPA: SynChlorMet cassette protein ScmC [Methanotrichaceae archaeon]|nr:SynChlorMet cassette protein ScmC [Methanotrichaceae archaeon]